MEIGEWVGIVVSNFFTKFVDNRKFLSYRDK